MIRSPIVFWRQGTARPVMGRDLLKQRLKLTGGKLKRASTMDSGVTLNILYILIEVNGESVVELDIFSH